MKASTARFSVWDVQTPGFQGRIADLEEWEQTTFEGLHQLRLLIDDETEYKTIIEQLICLQSENS